MLQLKIMTADGKQLIRTTKRIVCIVSKSLHVSLSEEDGHALATLQNADGQYVRQLVRAEANI